MMKPLLQKPSLQKPRRTAGFTLVELLLAMTLMSILLGLTYSGLRAATKSSTRGEEILAAGGELRAAHQFVRRQLNQMLPLAFAVTDDVPELRVVFDGTADRIQYVAPMPGYLGVGGPQVQLLELAPGNGGRVLQFSHALLQGFEQDLLYVRDPVILLEDVDSAEFEFLGRDDEGELTDWTSTWDQIDRLPVAIRLSIQFSGDVNLGWPDLVSGIRVDASAVQGNSGKPSYQQAIQDMLKGKGRDKS